MDTTDNRTIRRKRLNRGRIARILSAAAIFLTDWWDEKVKDVA